MKNENKPNQSPSVTHCGRLSVFRSLLWGDGRGVRQATESMESTTRLTACYPRQEGMTLAVGLVERA